MRAPHRWLEGFGRPSEESLGLGAHGFGLGGNVLSKMIMSSFAIGLIHPIAFPARAACPAIEGLARLVAELAAVLLLVVALHSSGLLRRILESAATMRFTVDPESSR